MSNDGRSHPEGNSSQPISKSAFFITSTCFCSLCSSLLSSINCNSLKRNKIVCKNYPLHTKILFSTVKYSINTKRISINIFQVRRDKWPKSNCPHYFFNTIFFFFLTKWDKH